MQSRVKVPGNNSPVVNISPIVKAPNATIPLPEDPALIASIAAARADESGGSLPSAMDSAEYSSETCNSYLHPEHRSLTQEQGLLRIYSRNQTRDRESFTAWNV